MKKIALPLLFLGGLITPIFTKAQATVSWTEFTRGVSIATDADENVYTVDWDYNPAGDIYLTKRNTDGALQWETKYENTDNTRHEVATWVETDLNGDILVTGTIRSGYSSPVNAASLLMKFDPAGNLLWRQVYESGFDGSYTRKCLIDADNNIYVLGMGSGPSGFVTKVKKFAPDGTPLWNYFDEAGIGAPINFKFTPDNQLVIAGRWIFGSGGGYAKIDLDGNKVWNYPGIFSLTVGDVAGDASGNSYIVHGQYDFDGGTTLKKVDPAGSLIWEQNSTIAAFRVEVGTDGSPVICGFPNSGSPGAAFIKYDASGALLWENLDADGPGNALLLHAQMQMDEFNNAYLAAGTLFQQALCKINANGTEGWTVLTSGSYANAFAFGNSSQNIYLVGGNTAKIVQDLPCDAPLGLYSNNLTATSVRLNWSPVTGAAAYEVQGRKAGSASWKTKMISGSKNKFIVNSLVPGTDYVWRIRTVCDPSGTTSLYSPEQTFSTPALRQEFASGFLVYPNPVQDLVNISFQMQENEVNRSVMIQVVNSAGSILAQRNVAPVSGILTTSFDANNWPSGLYRVVWTHGQMTGSEAFVIQR